VGDIDLSQYCREVEEHLTRVNGGHLVRIVGGGFGLVQQWAEAGMPLSVVCRGIDRKAERHSRGASRRPLRIEFCDADVREVYDEWRRAVGLPRGFADAGVPADADSGPAEAGLSAKAEADPGSKRPSLTKHLDRVIDRLSRAAGRVDLPDAFQQAIGDILNDVAALRDAARGARGEARDGLAAQLDPIDRRLIAAARAAAGADALTVLEANAAAELAGFRDRLVGGAWTHAIGATVDRLLRDRYGLPTIGL
jgi:hypothetical protein